MLCKSNTICGCPCSTRASSNSLSSTTCSPVIRSPPLITSTAPWCFCSNIRPSNLLRQRQRHVERAALVNLALDGDLSTVQPHDLLRQCQTQPGTGLLLHTRIGTAVKLLEYLV